MVVTQCSRVIILTQVAGHGMDVLKILRRSLSANAKVDLFVKALDSVRPTAEGFRVNVGDRQQLRSPGFAFENTFGVT
jgi:hypothetical protein